MASAIQRALNEYHEGGYYGGTCTGMSAYAYAYDYALTFTFNGTPAEIAQVSAQLCSWSTSFLGFPGSVWDPTRAVIIQINSLTHSAFLTPAAPIYA